MDRFRDLLVIILVLAGVAALLLGHVGDAIVIAAAVIIDAFLSFAQTWRTERTLQSMRKQIQDTITVIRNGTVTAVPSSEVVIGDIIEFRAGERIPADARLIKAVGLQTQESILTGEAADQNKGAAVIETRTPLANRTNMIYAGTIIVNGTGRAVITAVGPQTELGKIAKIIREQKPPISPLRRKLQRTGVRIGWTIILLVALLALLRLLRGETIYETTRTAITLIVSAIPEDLTMIMTIALTVGVARILAKGGAVKKLGSGEALGAATVICTDKTGTLTEGNMKALEMNFLQGDVIPVGAKKPREPYHELAYVGFSLANSAHRINKHIGRYAGPTTERTALEFVELAGYNQNELKSQWKLRDAIAFSPSWKYRACLVDHPTKSTQFIFVTGAPDVLLERSMRSLDEQNDIVSLSEEHRKTIHHRIFQLASEGRRLVAVAVKPHVSQSSITHSDIESLIFLGLLSIEDPVRREVSSAIAETVSAGVMVKLVTGDHAGTAKAIANQVGISANKNSILTGLDLQTMSDDHLAKAIDHINVFARVEPLDKQRIVRILQSKGHIVAMTGDGVNDAVALKSSDIGVAMGGGTDIAKDAADLVLLNNSLATIVAAIKEGRVLRDNIRKVTTFLLATNAAEVAIFFASILMDLPLPLLAAQILWINLVTDGTSDIALSLEPAEDNVMRRKPEDPSGAILDSRLIVHIVFAGVVMTFGTMLLFWNALQGSAHDIDYARTMAFTFLSTASLLSVWSFKSLGRTIFTSKFWTNKWIVVSTIFSACLQLIAIYLPKARSFFQTVPLNVLDWTVIILLAAITVAIIDLRKVIFSYRLVPDKNSWQYTKMQPWAGKAK